MISLSSENGRDGRDRFRPYDTSIKTLRSTVPDIHQALRPRTPLEKIEGWEAMVQRHDAFRSQGSQPVLVATLYGPTGAGKSTLFRMLTGVPVPSGDDVRPVSYACIISIPDALTQNGNCERLFPGFRLEYLTDVGKLRIDQGSATPVFWVPYSPEGKTQVVPLTLADVPDFNSMHESNWVKAERMMKRAEIVLFVVYRESYADAKVVTELARCCRLATRMAYILTKTDKPEQAGRIWDDLIGKLGSGDNPHGQAFRELRADGHTLHEFLSRCPVYYSPRTEPTRPPLVQPLSSKSPPIDSLLRGFDAENILLDGLLQPTRPVVQACRQMLSEVGERSAELQKKLEKAKKDLQEPAEAVAGTEFPVGRWLELVLEEAREHRNALLRILTAPGDLLARGLLQIAKGAKQFIDWFRSGGDEKIVKRYELERDRLRQAAEYLFDKWRSSFPQEVDKGGLLAQDRYGKIRDSFYGNAPPEPDTDWEKYVRRGVSSWAKKHPACAIKRLSWLTSWPSQVSVFWSWT